MLVITSYFPHAQTSAESSEEAKNNGSKFIILLSMQNIMLHGEVCI